MTDPTPAAPSQWPAATIAATVGGSAASLIVWVLSLYKIYMPAGIESQCGALIAAAACYIFERQRKV